MGLVSYLLCCLLQYYNAGHFCKMRESGRSSENIKSSVECRRVDSHLSVPWYMVGADDLSVARASPLTLSFLPSVSSEKTEV